MNLTQRRVNAYIRLCKSVEDVGSCVDGINPLDRRLPVGVRQALFAVKEARSVADARLRIAIRNLWRLLGEE